ncbi:TPA: lysis protein, partial [Yersinia enterocolitica]|nr:lysis protein [Yersinia enterocolitica]HEC4989474.1 lysis protein [Yersinia enterocolitica]
ASAGSILNGVLSYFNPEQWNTIGVLGGIIIAIMTFLTNLVFKIRDDRDRRRMIDAYQSKVEK